MFASRVLPALRSAVKGYQDVLDAPPEGNDAADWERWAEHAHLVFGELNDLFDFQPADRSCERPESIVLKETAITRHGRQRSTRDVRAEVVHLLDIVGSYLLTLTIPRSEVAEGNSGEQAQELLESSVELLALIRNHEEELAACLEDGASECTLT